MKTTLIRLPCALLLVTAACVDIDVDEDEIGPAPAVEFDPAARVVPFPNNLLLDPETGRVDLPEGCDESPATTATREQVLNQLDGFGTFETAISVTFTEPVDPASLEGNVLLLQRTADGEPVDPAAADPIPVVTIPGTTTRFDPSCTSETTVDSVTIVPLVPLEQRSTYVVALTEGIVTEGGEPFGASVTWALVRQTESPVTLDEEGNLVSERTPLDPSDPAQLEQLQGLALLWRAHVQALGFLEGTGLTRDEVLLAWEFTTQTVTDPLDPEVAGSPAAAIEGMPLVGPTGEGTPVSVTAAAADRTDYPYLVCTTGATDGEVVAAPEADDTQCFLKVALGGGSGCQTQEACEAAFLAGTGRCAAVGCAAVGDVLAGALLSTQYQAQTPNPRGDTCGAEGDEPCPPVPGPWSDPVDPDATGVEGIGALIMVPAAACPEAGCPTVIFGHGLGSSRTAAFAIAPQLAGAGFATVAIDFVAHGSRAVQISGDPERGCAAPTPGTAPQCYAPILSANLAATRDNVRQSVLDLQGLAAALAACGTDGCGDLVVDPGSIVYLGQSLGGIIGSIFTATSPVLQASVLNVAGAGWLDILENTENLTIRCSLVDALIGAGILEGDMFDPGDGQPTGLCLGDDWRTQPGYRRFSAIARWVIDPAEPANYARMLAGRPVLLQEVVDDQVVPNIASETAGALLGLTPMAADPGVPNPDPPPFMLPSAAITEDPTSSKWVLYETLPADAGAGFPGNTFQHASLLAPAEGAAGQLGTARMQTDAITFLIINR